MTTITLTPEEEKLYKKLKVMFIEEKQIEKDNATVWKRVTNAHKDDIDELAQFRHHNVYKIKNALSQLIRSASTIAYVSDLLPTNEEALNTVVGQLLNILLDYQRSRFKEAS